MVVMIVKISLFSLILLMFLFGNIANAGCVSGCKDEFDSEIQSCKFIWDDPDDSYMLESCIDSAKSSYQWCIDECTS